ncbi:tetratricopeptide repeat protein [Nocardia aurantia]|uniref:Photosystem I assembly protein Ycf3 n=1 Tax=Nocardia aurantia TaxID=2585199 RepID=A0A7K0DYQ6_9NOCA|nr:tetratricopeptide repeat protein [Nocardia aurantia]MQY30821.1 Photosystem I assembly protein Ycf3 [Nocardia aurantia]
MDAFRTAGDVAPAISTATDHAIQVNVHGSVSGGVHVAAREAARSARRRIVTNLPAPPRTFIGRQDELRRIVDGPKQHAAVAIYAIDGMPGVGKTAFAVRVAHELADRYPDGRYLLDLHGHTPGRRPVDPADAIAEMLLALGEDPAGMPATAVGRLDLWRARTSEARTLLVLDDAADRSQVEPLLPSGSGCLTLITSRRRLLLPDMRPLSLAVLDPPAAEELFRTVGGRDPDAAGEREIVARTAALCGYLPLAIGLVAGQVAQHPHWTTGDLGDLAAELAAETDRLSVVDGSEGPTVRAAFDLSYRKLPANRRKFFRQLGSHPGPDLGADAVAALTGVPRTAARRELATLHRDHLLEETTRGRYRLHDLLRGYARTLGAPNAHANNAVAVNRLLDHYQQTATDADRWLSGPTRPAGRVTGGNAHRVTGGGSADRVTGGGSAQCVTAGDNAQGVTAGSGAGHEFADAAAALRWLRGERANLLACLDYCAEHDLARLVALTGRMAGLLILDGPWQQARSIHRRAVDAAVLLGDPVGAAVARANLGRVHNLLGEYRPAREAQRQALETFRLHGDRSAEAAVHGDLGLAAENIGEYAEAAAAQRRALVVHRELGNRMGEAHTVRRLGAVYQAAGDFRQAAGLLAAAADRYRELGDRLGEAHALGALGTLRQSTGNHTDAVALHGQALNILRAQGNRLGEANTLRDLGLLRHIEGDRDGAAELRQQALDIYRWLGHRLGEADALTAFGVAHWRTGDFVEAVHHQLHAAAIFRESGDRLGEAGTLVDLGLVYERIGHPEQAGELYRRALLVFEDIGNRLGYADTLGNLAALRRAEGRHGSAAGLYRQALLIFRDIGSRLGEAKALAGLGRARESAADFGGEARELYRQALDVFREIGSRRGEAETLVALTRVHRNAGDYDDAVDLLERARDLYRHSGNRLGEVETHNGLGWLLLETGRVPEALRLFTEVLGEADRIHNRLERAHALEGAARCRTIRGDASTATAQLEEALTIYRGLGSPEADRTARYLARRSDA